MKTPHLPTDEDPDYLLLRLRTVQLIVGLSSASIYRYIRLGTFPAPIKLGLRASAWRWGDIRAWIKARSSP